MQKGSGSMRQLPLFFGFIHYQPQRDIDNELRLLYADLAYLRGAYVREYYGEFGQVRKYEQLIEYIERYGTEAQRASLRMLLHKHAELWKALPEERRAWCGDNRAPLTRDVWTLVR